MKFYLQQIPEGADSLNNIPIQREIYEDDQSLISSQLMVDNQLEIRVGGPFYLTSTGPLMESWGDNGAEQLWSRLQKMDRAKGCLYNLRLSGHMMGFPDFAKADPSCAKQTNDVCKM